MAVPKTRNPQTTSVTKYAVDAFLITPSDSTDLSEVTRAISFGTVGTLRIITQDGTTLTIPSGALAAGIMHPIGAQRVLSTGTTAANIVGWV